MQRIIHQIGRLTTRFLLLTLVLAGLLSGLAAVLFHHLVEASRSLLIAPALKIAGVPHYVLTLLIPALVAVILTLVVQRFAPHAGGANLARVRRAYGQDPAILDKRSIIATLLLTPISLGSGAPLGPEGPTVVIASGVSMYLARLLRLPKKAVRGMIPVGTAAGIAAIFNTPITGVVFAMEEVLGTTSRGVLGGTIVAAVAAAVVQRLLLGGRQLLEAPTGEWHDVRELSGFLVVGIVAGIVSGIAIIAISRLRKFTSHAIPSAVVRAGSAGLLVGAIGLISPDILGVGYSVTSLFLHGGGDLNVASLAFAAKTIGMIIAISGGIIGGTFAPSLFIGAALGATVGHAARMMFPTAIINPAAYALVGMGAFFGGFLRCPIAAVLIVVELTGDYGLVLPLMMAVAVAVYITRRIAPHSLTELQMASEGYREPTEADADPISGLAAKDIMSLMPLSLDGGMTILEAARKASGTRFRQYPVVNVDHKLVGILSSAQIDAAAAGGNVEERIATIMEPPKFAAHADEPLRSIVRKMAQHNVDRCPVVAAGESEVLVGFLAPEDFLRARIRSLPTTLETEVDVFG